MTLRVLVADDEEMARRRLSRLAAAVGGVVVVAECATGDAALDALESLEIDVAVLDIEMPGLSGLDLSAAAADLGVEIVLATAHAEHALAAFERGVADYVLKPVDGARLAQALERVRARVGHARAAAPGVTSATPAERIAIEAHGEVRLFAPSDVESALLDGELVRLRVGHETIWTDRSLADLEARLGEPFLRVHRRALLALAHVDRLRPLSTGGYVALTRSGDEIPVSRQAARRLRQRLGIGRD